jgi:hypothetical protein
MLQGLMLVWAENWNLNTLCQYTKRADVVVRLAGLGGTGRSLVQVTHRLVQTV